MSVYNIADIETVSDTLNQITIQKKSPQVYNLFKLKRQVCEGFFKVIKPSLSRSVQLYLKSYGKSMKNIERKRF